MWRVCVHVVQNLGDLTNWDPTKGHTPTVQPKQSRIKGIFGAGRGNGKEVGEQIPCLPLMVTIQSLLPILTCIVHASAPACVALDLSHAQTSLHASSTCCCSLWSAYLALPTGCICICPTCTTGCMHKPAWHPREPARTYHTGLCMHGIFTCGCLA